MEEEGRRLLVLSDRREHLVAFFEGFKACGFTSIGYYVGGMKQKDLDASAKCTIILGTFAMASEGMNIPALNSVLLATPKSNIEQSIGRILRLKPEERTVEPIIFDVLDTAFGECNGQWLKRRKFYKECGYTIRWSDEDTTTEEDEDAAPAAEKGVPLFVDEDSVLPTVITIDNIADFVDAVSSKTKPKRPVKGKALFVCDA
jgi:superfamily II DNA or RNA helicase